MKIDQTKIRKAIIEFCVSISIISIVFMFARTALLTLIISETGIALMNSTDFSNATVSTTIGTTSAMFAFGGLAVAVQCIGILSLFFYITIHEDRIVKQMKEISETLKKIKR